MAQSETMRMNGGSLVYFQYLNELMVYGLDMLRGGSVSALVIGLVAGGGWRQADIDEGRIRTELRNYSACPLDEWSTASFTLDRKPDFFPLLPGGHRPNKVTHFQGFGAKVPAYWIETYEGRTQVFMNSSVSKDPRYKGAHDLDIPAHSKTRFVITQRPRSDGKLDLIIKASVNGGPFFIAFEVYDAPMESGADGFRGFHNKVGLYMSRDWEGSAGHAYDPMPDLAVILASVDFHRGLPTVMDYSGDFQMTFTVTSEDKAEGGLLPLPMLDPAEPIPGPSPLPAPQPNPTPDVPKDPPGTSDPAPAPDPVSPAPEEPVQEEPDKDALNRRDLMMAVDGMEEALNKMTSHFKKLFPNEVDDARTIRRQLSDMKGKMETWAKAQK